MFRKLTDRLWVAPQISIADVAEAASMGIALIINNRPEHEADDQPAGADIAAAAAAAGISYVAIPVTHAGFSAAQVAAMGEALAKADSGEKSGVLAFCRSGTRSTLLWALARASEGDAPDALAAQAAAAGYDLTPVRAMMDVLAPR